jgi:hypothetical protein
MTSVAASAEATDGVNVRLTVQDAPAAMLAPQVLDGEAKSLALFPLKARAPAENGIGSEVLFVNVTVRCADVTLTGCVPKSTLAGVTANAGINVSFATNASDGPFRLV